ncbi:MAG: sugar ABC transporter permease [Deinococcota bacterium]
MFDAFRGRQQKEPVSSLAREQQIWGWIFLSPWIIGFLAFTVIPLVASVVFSFLDFQLNKPDEITFAGWKNYRLLFTDPLVRDSLVVTFKFAAISLPIGMILPIALASLMNNKYLAGKRFFRTLFYMPFIVPVVSAVFIWRGMLSTQTGWINRILGLVGIPGPDWLNSQVWIYPALVIIGIWGIGNAFLITLAGMQGVPTAYYEAAKVDGANPFRRFWSITLPLISPVIFFNLILSVIGLMRYFEVPFIFNGGNGNPGGATMFFNIHFYKTTFVFFDMGYGSALAWLLFVITMILTLILFGTAKYWVYYAGAKNE